MNWIKQLASRRRNYADLSAEIQEHLEEKIAELEEAGMPREEAAAAARREFGNAMQLEESGREVWEWTFIENLLADVRFAARVLRKKPGFTALVILTLALGIGANTALYTAVDRALLRPLPYLEGGRLVVLWEDASRIGFPRNQLSPADYFDWRQENTVFEDVAAMRYRQANLKTSGAPEMAVGSGVTANFFSILRTAPLMGRTFTEQEDEARIRMVILSYRLWQGAYGGDPAIVGKNISMDGSAVTVIGVMPEWFVFPNTRTEYWAPANFTPKDKANRGSHYVGTVARLKPGVSLQRARAEMTALAARLERTYPESNAHIGAVVRPLREELTGEVRTPLLILLAAACCVLLIACSNVANLLLARAMERRREMAVRLALGASRKRLVQQILTGSVVLAGLGGLCGLLFARWGMLILQGLVPKNVSALPLALDGKVIAFACLTAMAAGVLAGLPLALQGTRQSGEDALKQGGRTGTTMQHKKMRNALVIAQVALALVLLMGAGLLLETLARMGSTNPGFNPDHLLTMVAALPEAKYSSDSQRLSFVREVRARVQALPGVKAVGFASDLPFASIGDTNGFRVEGRAEPASDTELDALYRETTADYLPALGARLVEGRFFGSQDRETSLKVVIINETFAKAFWPDAHSAIGKRIQVGDTGPGKPWWTIVGVVADIRERGLLLGMKPATYMPANQVQRPEAYALAIRTAGDPLALARAVRQAVWAVDPDQPVSEVQSMRDLMERETSSRRQAMILLGAFAGLALLLASLGIYGVISYAVTQRTHEFGIRIALGARSRDIAGPVVRQGLKLAAAGIAAGFIGTLGITRFMQSFLFGVAANDPGTLASVLLLLAAVAVAASYLPARRASKVDPMVALRYE